MESSFYMYEMPQVEEIMYDPVDEVVVMDCCPAACYKAFPCCRGDPDSPLWQEWYKHRLQISRWGIYQLSCPFITFSIFGMTPPTFFLKLAREINGQI